MQSYYWLRKLCIDLAEKKNTPNVEHIKREIIRYYDFTKFIYFSSREKESYFLSGCLKKVIWSVTSFYLISKLSINLS